MMVVEKAFGCRGLSVTRTEGVVTKFDTDEKELQRRHYRIVQSLIGTLGERWDGVETIKSGTTPYDRKWVAD